MIESVESHGLKSWNVKEGVFKTQENKSWYIKAHTKSVKTVIYNPNLL